MMKLLQKLIYHLWYIVIVNQNLKKVVCWTSLKLDLKLDTGSLPPGVNSGLEVKTILGLAAKYIFLIKCLTFRTCLLCRLMLKVFTNVLLEEVIEISVESLKYI